MGIASFQPPVTTPVKGTSLAEMMGMAQNAQALQQAKQLNPLQIQQAQGALELQRLQTQKAQQTLEPEVELAKTNAEKAKTELNDAQLLNLQKQQANSSRNLIKMLDSPEPVTPARIKDHVVATMSNAGATDAAIVQAVQGLPTKGTDKELRAYLAKHTLNSLTAEAELEKRFPAATMVSEGGQITPRQMGAEAFTGVKPGTAVGQSVGMTPAPLGYGQRYEPTGRVDTNNNPTAYVRDAQGNILGEVTIPAGVNQQQIIQPSGAQKGNMQQGGAQLTVNQPPTNAPSRLAPYETPETVAAERKRQLDTIAQRQTVSQSTYNYNQIIDLADKSITGVGAQQIAKLSGGYAGIPWKADEASNLQQLGHFMALQTGNLAQQAGLGTDQGRSIAQDQIGTTNWTNDAIKATARTNRALVTGIDLYGLGMNNAIKKAGNNPLAGRDYTEKWSSVADINALKYYDAIKNKDKTEIRQIVDKVGGPDSKGYADLITRYNKIYSLVTGGQ